MTGTADFADDKGTLVGSGGLPGGLTPLGLLFFLFLASGGFYAVFIFSPSQIADPKGAWPELTRFGAAAVSG